MKARLRITGTMAKPFRVPKDNLTVYLATGRNAWHRAQRSPLPFMYLPDRADPAAYQYPVKGCGVIIYDSQGMSSERYGRLLAALKTDGAACVIHYNTHKEAASMAWDE